MKKILYLLLFILSVNSALSQSDSIQTKKIYSVADLEKVIQLNSLWKSKIGNDSLWAGKELDDSTWEERKTQFTILKRNPQDSVFNGEIWFRYRFDIDSTLVNVPVSLSVISKGDAVVFLNKKYLGKYGNPDHIFGKAEKNAPVIFAFKKPGEQVLSVHYKDTLYKKDKLSFNQQGFEISLMTPEKFVEKSEQNYYLWTIFSSLGVIFLTLGVIHLILFGFYRKFIPNLFFGIFNICSGFSLLFIYSNSFIDGFNMIRYMDAANSDNGVFNLIGGLAISATVNFLFSKNKTRFYIFVALVTVIVFLAYFVSKTFVLFYSFITPIIMFEAIIVVFIAALQKKQGARIIAGGLLLSFTFALLFGFIIGIISGMGKTNTFLMVLVVIFGVLAFFSTPFAMSAYLASNFASVSRQLKKQLKQVNSLSEQTLKKEQEKQELLENKKHFLESEVKERTKEIEEQKQQIEEQQQALLVEKQKSEDLLLNILPKDIADELKEKGESKIKQFDDVSILFTDFTNLDKVSDKLSSQELLDELNHCFKAFDHITTRYEIEKIKTIGYSYMAVCGLPMENKNHAQKMIEVAMEMRNFIQNYQQERIAENKPYFKIKIGLNSGEVVAGIVGIRKFAYDIWGDAVNTAARMKGRSEEGKINVSQATYELAKEQYDFEYRGELEIKGKGLTKMYFVENKK